MLSATSALDSVVATLRDRLAAGCQVYGELEEQLAGSRDAMAEAQAREQTTLGRLREAEGRLLAALEGSREAREELEVDRQVHHDVMVLALKKTRQVEAARVSLGRLRSDLERETKAREKAGLAEKLTQSHAAVEVLKGRVAALTEKLAAGAKELAELRCAYRQEVEEHDALRVAVGVVLSDLDIASEEGSSSLAPQVPHITARARGMASDALPRGVHRAFAIACSHYSNIALDLISEGFAPGYTDAELDEIEDEVAPLAQALTSRIEEEDDPTSQ